MVKIGLDYGKLTVICWSTQGRRVGCELVPLSLWAPPQCSCLAQGAVQNEQVILYTYIGSMYSGSHCEFFVPVERLWVYPIHWFTTTDWCVAVKKLHPAVSLSPTSPLLLSLTVTRAGWREPSTQANLLSSSTQTDVVVRERPSLETTSATSLKPVLSGSWF